MNTSFQSVLSGCLKLAHLFSPPPAVAPRVPQLNIFISFLFHFSHSAEPVVKTRLLFAFKQDNENCHLYHSKGDDNGWRGSWGQSIVIGS